MGICASSSLSSQKPFLLGKSGGDESARDGKTWYSKHVQREGSEVAMYFDKVVSEDYHISKKKIGSGMQGSVYEGTAREKDSSGEKVAIKETHIGAMNKNSGERRKEAYAELETLSRMRHPNIVQLIAAYQTSSELQLVMEKIDGKGLISYLVECDEKLASGAQTEKEQREEKFSLMRQLCDAVAHVHARNVCFRDLQPENVMITNQEPRQVKLIDFGRAVVLKRKDHMEGNLQPMGTSLFQAPEVEKRCEYGQASDMWAVGVFLYLLISNKMPFSRTVEGVYAVLRGSYEPFDETFNKQARSLVSKLLVVNPSSRMNAAQVNQHKYLRKFVQMKEEYQKAGTNVSRERDILVPATMQKDVERSLLALEETKDITKECVKILCKLSAQDVATLRRWLNMSSEKSVHEGKANVGLKVESKKNGNKRREEDAEREENNGEGESGNDGGGSSNEGSRTSNGSYSWNDDSTHRGNAKVGTDGLAHLAHSFRKSLDEDPEARSFIGLAHEQGLSSLDELITACVASGLFKTADQIVELESNVLAKRRNRFGGENEMAKITSSKNAQETIRNTVLVRHGDLLRLVETTQVERMKEASFSDDDDNGSSPHKNSNSSASATTMESSSSFYNEAKKKISPERLSRDGTNPAQQPPGSLEGSLRGGNSFRKPRGGMPATLNRKLEEVRREASLDNLVAGGNARALVRNFSSGSLLAHSESNEE
jgi:serine/threonine protein kinase